MVVWGELRTVMQMKAKAAAKALMVMPTLARRTLAIWPEEAVSGSPAKTKPSKANPIAKAEAMVVLIELVMLTVLAMQVLKLMLAAMAARMAVIVVMRSHRTKGRVGDQSPPQPI